ncbi:MAG: hypothetical protein WAU28_00540 [Candidatus Moraniibacteriota bacterium]
MNQEMQSLVFLVVWVVVMNIVFFGFLRGNLGEKVYEWRVKRNLMMEGVTKEDFVKKMKTISSVVLVFANAVFVLIVLRMLLR